MRNIVPAIVSLPQYLEIQHSDPGRLRPTCCPHCGNEDLWNHGHYDRKANRKNTSNILNSISAVPTPICQNLLAPRKILNL